MLLVSKSRLTRAALRDCSILAMRQTLSEAAKEAARGTLALPEIRPRPVLNTRVLRTVANDVLGAYDTLGVIDIAHSWVLGAGLEEAAAIADGRPICDPVVSTIRHHYWVRFTMQVLFSQRPGNEDTITRVFSPLLSWNDLTTWW
jgi:hypothetical protein